jgi:nitrite reductase/ring-hydroxylating ferredoxin subunit
MYDVRTGECVFPGRGARVPTYPARVDDGEMWLELPAGG